MIDNNLSMILGQRLEKISILSQNTGLSRSTLTEMYYKRLKGVSLKTLETLCLYFDCDVGDILKLKKE